MYFQIFQCKYNNFCGWLVLGEKDRIEDLQLLDPFLSKDLIEELDPFDGKGSDREFDPFKKECLIPWTLCRRHRAWPVAVRVLSWALTLVAILGGATAALATTFTSYARSFQWAASVVGAVASSVFLAYPLYVSTSSAKLHRYALRIYVVRRNWSVPASSS